MNTPRAKTYLFRTLVSASLASYSVNPAHAYDFPAKQYPLRLAGLDRVAVPPHAMPASAYGFTYLGQDAQAERQGKYRLAALRTPVCYRSDLPEHIRDEVIDHEVMHHVLDRLGLRYHPNHEWLTRQATVNWRSGVAPLHGELSPGIRAGTSIQDVVEAWQRDNLASRHLERI